MSKKKRIPAPPVPALRVGLLGLGNVGSGVAEIVSRHGRHIAARTGIHLEVVRAVVRRARRRRQGVAGGVPVTTRPQAVIGAKDVDVVVELVGGIEPARTFILDALAAGQPVVTANKAVLAACGDEILTAAARAQNDIFFEASVAGGLPIIRTLREGLAGDRITAMTGILNGTTNYILERMAGGEPYADALRQAQTCGYAEADPTLDVTGRDAADKLAILVRLAYGTAASPDRIPTRGITELDPAVLADADSLGYRVKLLAIARRLEAGLDLRVHPAFVSENHALATVPGAQNAIAVTSDSLGPTLYQGAGAGGLPTGSAVVADLIEMARNLRAGITSRVTQPRSPRTPRLLPPKQTLSAHYVRLKVAEKPGVLAAVTRILARNDVSLATVLQRERGVEKKRPVPVVLVTHPARQGSMDRALRDIGRLEALRGSPNVVRIEGD